MKKFLLTLLVIVVAFGALSAAGWTGYRYGYMQGASVTSNSDDVVKPFAPGNGFRWNKMPMHQFNQRMMNPGFHHQGFGLGGGMRMRGGFGFFSPLILLARLAFYAFLIWAIYKLFTGWRINFTQVNQKPGETESKNSNT